MGKGARAEDVAKQAESTERLLAFEQGFSSKLGYTTKCCCCKLSVGVQLIAVLVVLSAMNYFLTFVSRTGAPCFFCACLEQSRRACAHFCSATPTAHCRCCKPSRTAGSRSDARADLVQGTTTWRRPSLSSWE